MNDSASNLKKLMKIIYQKEKQVEKYRKQLKERNRNRVVATQNLHRYRGEGQETEVERGFSEEQKNTLTTQVNQNMEILKTATKKILQMEKTIGYLQADLDEEAIYTAEIIQQLHEAKLEISKKDQHIADLKTNISLLQNSKTLSREQNSGLQNQVENYRLENSKLKLLLEDLSQQKFAMASKLQKAETQISKYLQILNRRSNQLGPRSATALALSRTESRKQKRLHTFTNLDNIEDSFQEKMKQILEVFRNWESSLASREREWRQKFQASLCQEGSIDGISRLIKQSFVLAKQNQLAHQDSFLDDSSFKRNEDRILAQLEKECQEQIPYNSIEKQNIVELNQVKQSLKMTKQVNAQLFDELGKQQKIISMFKETFTSMQRKKLFKSQNTEQVIKIRHAFGQRK